MIYVETNNNTICSKKIKTRRRAGGLLELWKPASSWLFCWGLGTVVLTSRRTLMTLAFKPIFDVT
jgi:hypothetical protein